MHPERNLGGWVKRLPALEVKTRQMQRAGHGRPVNSRRRKEATIQLAILVRTDTVDRQELAATIDHQDCDTTWPGESHRAVGKFYCGKEALGWHVVRLGGECSRLLCQRRIELRRQDVAQTLRLSIERECGNDGLKEAHHDGATRFGIGQPARS